MVVNPVGFVPIYDFGAPRVISGRAREVISGGQFVVISGAADYVSSGANSFDNGADVKFALGASGLAFTGIAMADAASGAPLSVAIDGIHIVRAIGTVTEGTTVICQGDDAVLTGTTAGQVIGRALSTATSGNYALVHLKP